MQMSSLIAHFFKFIIFSYFFLFFITFSSFFEDLCVFLIWFFDFYFLSWIMFFLLGVPNRLSQGWSVWPINVYFPYAVKISMYLHSSLESISFAEPPSKSFLGYSLIQFWSIMISDFVTVSKMAPFGCHLLTNLFWFSLLPRSQLL